MVAHLLGVEHGVTRPETAVASGVRLPFAPPLVHVNPRLWREIAGPCRAIDLFHGMGTRLPHRRHVRGDRPGPMHWNTVPCGDHLEHRERYLQEWFHPDG